MGVRCQASRHKLGVGQVLAFIAFWGWLLLISFRNHALLNCYTFDATSWAHYSYQFVVMTHFCMS